MLVFCTLLWAVSFPAIKALMLTQQTLLPAGTSWFFSALGVTYRFSLAGIILLLLTIKSMRTVNRREMEQGVILAGFGGLGIVFQMDGLAYTSASTSAFLTQGYCLFIPLWVALVNWRWPSFKIFLSIVLVLAGVGVLAEISLHSFRLGRGEIETLIASLLFTGQILMLEHPRYAENRPMCLSVVMLLGTGLVAAPMALATAPTASAWIQAYMSWAAVSDLGIITIFCTLAAYGLMNAWQRRVTATEAGLIYCAEPVFASLMALFMPAMFSKFGGISYDNENLTLRLLIGGGLITAANVLLQSRWLEPKRTV